MLPHRVNVIKPLGFGTGRVKLLLFANAAGIAGVQTEAAVCLMRDQPVDPALAFALRGVGRVSFVKTWTEISQIRNMLPKPPQFVG